MEGTPPIPPSRENRKHPEWVKRYQKKERKPGICCSRWSITFELQNCISFFVFIDIEMFREMYVLKYKARFYGSVIKKTRVRLQLTASDWL